MKKAGKQLIVVILILTLSMSLALNVFAGNACKQISGSSNGSCTFTVETGNVFLLSEKITFDQDKGVLGYRNWVHDYQTKKAYDSFTISYQKKGSSEIKTKTMDGGSCSIKLDPYSTYTVTVTPSNAQMLQINHWTWGSICGWESPATWRVKSTRGIDLCG